MREDLDRIAELQAQVQRLERRVAALEGRNPEREPTSNPAAPEPKRLESKLGLTLINRAGAITLAIGILFFFKYAVDSRWIGAAGRVALGIAAGVLLLILAERLRKRAQQAFAQGVAGCGIAVVYTAFYASFVYYHLFPQALAFAGMFAACALAFRYASPALASIGTAGAILIPVLLGCALNRPWFFFLYLVALAAIHFVAATSQKLSPGMRNCLYALGHACLLAAALRELYLWAVGHSAPVDRASVIGESASVFLAIYALAAIAWGMARRSPVGRMLGLVLLLAVVGKLYLYDVWQLTRFYRISAFVALGILLLSASYLYSRFREKLGKFVS